MEMFLVTLGRYFDGDSALWSVLPVTDMLGAFLGDSH